MKPDDLRAMTIDQLDDEVLKLKKEQFNLRFQRATGQLENTSRVRQVRRDIARIKTVATQKRPAQPGSVPAKFFERRDDSHVYSTGFWSGLSFGGWASGSTIQKWRSG